MAVSLLARRRADLCGMRVAPAHKGDVNVIRAHWSGKSSTGSWRLDGEVSPGFWGGWGRSRRGQRLYGWRSKLKWGARARAAERSWVTCSSLNCGPLWISKDSPAPPVCPGCTRCRAKSKRPALSSRRKRKIKKSKTLFLARSSFALRSSLLPQPFGPRMFWKIFFPLRPRSELAATRRTSGSTRQRLDVSLMEGIHQGEFKCRARDLRLMAALPVASSLICPETFCKCRPSG